MGSFLLFIISKLLVVLFFVGLVGSAIVVIITFVEDGKVLLESDEPKKTDKVVPAGTREAF